MRYFVEWSASLRMENTLLRCEAAAEHIHSISVGMHLWNELASAFEKGLIAVSVADDFHLLIACSATVAPQLRVCAVE